VEYPWVTQSAPIRQAGSHHSLPGKQDIGEAADTVVLQAWHSDQRGRIRNEWTTYITLDTCCDSKAPDDLTGANPMVTEFPSSSENRKAVHLAKGHRSPDTQTVRCA
jgi:hypothetical protein